MAGGDSQAEVANSPTHPVLLKESQRVPPRLLPLPLYILSGTFHPKVFFCSLAGLKLTLLLRTTLHPKCWGYRCGSPHPVMQHWVESKTSSFQVSNPPNLTTAQHPPLKLQLYSHSVCVHVCGPACGDQRITVGAGPLLSPIAFQGPNLGSAVSIFIH